MGTRIYDSAGNIKEEAPEGAVGQKPSAQSSSVVISSDQPAIPVNSSPVMKQTYMATGAIPVVAGNNLTIQGSATKIVRVQSILIAQTATAVIRGQVLFRLRFLSAVTAGTPIIPVKHDSLNAAATAVIHLNATVPTVSGVMGADFTLLDDNGAIGKGLPIRFNVPHAHAQPPTLRGINEYFQVNIEGLFDGLSGGTVDATIMFTEE